MTVEAGLGFVGDLPLGRYGPLARQAEQLGFEVVTVFGDLGYQPPIAPLLEMAAATERVRLGPACLNPYTLHPVEIAGQIAALDQASDGRAFLGLARGAWLGDVGVAQAEPVATLRRAAEAVARLLSGEDALLRYPRRRPRVPLMIGTWGRRTAALAGEIADELKIGGSANPAVAPVMREWIGTDAVRIVYGAVTVVDQDGAAARALAKQRVALYLAVVGGLDPTLSLPTGLLEDLRGAQDPAALVTDELLDLFAFAGTPESVADQAAAVYAAGAHRIEFGPPHGLTPEGGIALLGEHVLPTLRRA